MQTLLGKLPPVTRMMAATASGAGASANEPDTIAVHFELPGDIRRMMDEQRAIERSQPSDQRIYIWGEIQIHHLTQAGFHIYPIGSVR